MLVIAEFSPTYTVYTVNVMGEFSPAVNMVSTVFFKSETEFSPTMYQEESFTAKLSKAKSNCHPGAQCFKLPLNVLGHVNYACYKSVSKVFEAA